MAKICYRLATTDQDHASAAQLVNSRYGLAGYGDNHGLPEGGFTFLAERADGFPVGTVTLRSNKPLLLEATFSDVIERARQAGDRPCELTRLAARSGGVGVGSIKVLCDLFARVYEEGVRLCDATHLYAQVLPRHVEFYRTRFGMGLIGPARWSAPAQSSFQLLGLSVEEIPARLAA